MSRRGVRRPSVPTPTALSTRAFRALRALFRLTLVAVVCAVILFVAGPHLARALGHDVYAVRSGSMARAIDVGALVIVERSGAAEIAVGDVVSVRLRNDVVLTHRVTATEEEGGMRYLQLKGDANAQIDPWTVREDDVIGPVRASLPYAGYVLALLSLPIGVAALFSIVSSLLTALWLLEDADDESDDEPAVAGGVLDPGALDVGGVPR